MLRILIFVLVVGATPARASMSVADSLSREIAANSLVVVALDVFWNSTLQTYSWVPEETWEEIREDSGYEDFLRELIAIPADHLSEPELLAFAEFLATPEAESLRVVFKEAMWRSWGEPGTGGLGPLAEELAAMVRDSEDPILAGVAEQMAAMDDAMGAAFARWALRYSEVGISRPAPPDSGPRRSEPGSYPDFDPEAMAFLDDGPEVDELPRPVRQKSPGYPVEARRLGLEADVWVGIRVASTGEVAEVRLLGIVSDDPEADYSILVDAAIRAAGKWTFQPALWDGRPVEGRVALPFSFQLR